MWISPEFAAYATSAFVATVRFTLVGVSTLLAPMPSLRTSAQQEQRPGGRHNDRYMNFFVLSAFFMPLRAQRLSDLDEAPIGPNPLFSSLVYLSHGKKKGFKSYYSIVK